MPFVETTVNVEITDQKAEAIKAKLGKAISIIPGKSESRLMLNFKDGCKMYFKGDNSQPIAFIEVKLFGRSSKDAYNKLTAALCGIFNEELGIDPSQVFVKYEENEHWGWNGSNF